jgi:hypothetical protein
LRPQFQALLETRKIAHAENILGAVVDVQPQINECSNARSDAPGFELSKKLSLLCGFSAGKSLEGICSWPFFDTICFSSQEFPI